MISVIVPVYNAEKTIERCVRSILGQQYSEKEIILVNDGSKDGSLKILRSLEEEHSEIIVVDKHNGGVSSARNAGLDICTGEYVTFIDSDDYYLSDNYIGNMVNLMEAKNDVDLVVSGYTVLSREQKEPIAVHDHIKDIQCVAEEFWQYRKWGVMNSPCNKVFRASLIREKFPEEMTMGEDAVFVLQYLRYCRQIAFNDHCGYGYIYELTSSTAQYRKETAYDMRQSAIYYDAVHDFWKCFLPEEKIALSYIQMRTDEVYGMMLALLSLKGFREYLRRDITEVISDSRFLHYYTIVAEAFRNHPRRAFIKAIAYAEKLPVKLYCLYYREIEILNAHMRKIRRNS